MDGPSGLDEFNTRHLGAVTLAVTGLEDAGVATGPLGEPRAELLKQLVGRATLLHVASRKPARVQGAGAGLGDQLLDEGTQFLGLRLCRLDGPLFDEGGGEVAEEREASVFEKVGTIKASLRPARFC